MRSSSPKTRPDRILCAGAIHIENTGSAGVTDACECSLKGIHMRCTLPAGFMLRARASPANVV